MNFKSLTILFVPLLLLSLLPLSGEAKPVTRKEASKVLREGEYSSNGKWKRKLASKEKPSKKAKKKNVKNNTKKALKKKVPKPRIKKKSIPAVVLPDPGSRREALIPAIVPESRPVDGVLERPENGGIADPAVESVAPSVPESVVPTAPESISPAADAAYREPDVFDLR